MFNSLLSEGEPMSDLIVNTLVLPLGLGLLSGVIALALRPGWMGWLLAAVVFAVIYFRLEGLPPLPPVASKHRLGYVLAAIALLAPLLAALPRPGRVAATIVLLLAGGAWIGQTKVLATTAWPGIGLLVPLPVLLGLGVALLSANRPAPDGLFMARLPLLTMAIGGAVIALIGGFVGMGQLSGAIAAAIGGSLIVAYGALLLGRGEALSDALAPAHWLIGAALSAIILITALFAPSPDPLALYVLALTPLASLAMPRLAGRDSRLKPIIFGFIAALPAAAAGLIAYLNSVAGG
jgi:MFS family permease